MLEPAQSSKEFMQNYRQQDEMCKLVYSHSSSEKKEILSCDFATPGTEVGHGRDGTVNQPSQNSKCHQLCETNV